jgi:hypothetical protein
MEFTGKIQNVSRDWQTGQFQIAFTVNEPSAIGHVDNIKDCEKLSINVEEYRDNRSKNANRLLWNCLSKIAVAMTPPVDKWDVYLEMLKRYGKFTYICVKPNMVEAMKKQWRETEVIGDIDINGTKAVQLLCYFGSSTLNTKEFSVLLDGVISEMAEMGLQTPTSQEMQMALEKWEKMQKGKKY